MLAIAAGVILGASLNGAIIAVGPLLVPNPEGFDNSTMERLNETIHLLTPANFAVVFLAHALGTLLAAFLASKIAAQRKMILALMMGVVFLAGGITMVREIPNAPMWFNVVDLVFAYIPMAYLGGKLGTK
jgi:ABC-type transport system involved in cytochrome c biogenesis permease subunit